jgi:hypothetical protein
MTLKLWEVTITKRPILHKPVPVNHPIVTEIIISHHECHHETWPQTRDARLTQDKSLVFFLRKPTNERLVQVVKSNQIR